MRVVSSWLLSALGDACGGAQQRSDHPLGEWAHEGGGGKHRTAHRDDLCSCARLLQTAVLL